MSVKEVTAITGVAAALLSFAGAIGSWIMAAWSGSRMNDYIRTNHPNRWSQLHASLWTTNTEHWFYIFDNNYEGDPKLEPLKRNTRKWTVRFLMAIGMFAACLLTTFIAMQLLKT